MAPTPSSSWSRRSVIGAGLGAGAALLARPALAQTYPTRPIRFVVGYAPGGTTDVLARLIAEPLGRRLGQQVLVENRPGAANNIGTDAVVRAEPDGYTILLANPANGINDSLYKKLNFNFQRDIAPVAAITRSPNIMEISPKLPVKSVAEFIAYCKANPDKVNMASSGVGTSVHMSGELFKAMTGVSMVHVPYRGAGPAITDLLAGNADVLSVAETVPGYEASAWFGIGAPRKTPPELIAHLNREVNEVLADPAMAKKLADLGGAPLQLTPEAFGALIAQEVEKWRKVVAFSGATVD
ncbi:tripartite tricarboxylate transporter substrate binding protein [Methylobacterium mesophilicum SR1.6/6]|uniref:Tripartite tricarboxylate transporter substrate binding protein n=1 Tax=Methylobacterium mesophilicum SR1.6/6 TaxID=908290 RepID=A0A6B9FA98_9HYPH|nr:tripartite tricarboxylate transporter substrate binding protein [Methylobacterium mesophilicum]QGY00781.1 tripartite tricarboxylate transporter substrate binding protein [Methylobacterium mesophilicum SR1.6/6]